MFEVSILPTMRGKKEEYFKQRTCTKMQDFGVHTAFWGSHQVCIPRVRGIRDNSVKNVCCNVEFVLWPVKYKNPSKNYETWENKLQKAF